MTNKSFSYGFGAASIAAVALMGAGCSTEETQATNVWKDPSYVAGPMKNIVVMGVKLNETDRRTLEDGFATALSSYGVHATPSYSVLPTPYPSKEAARALLQNAGFDGALVAKLTRVSENATVVNGDAGFWGGYYYGAGWGEPYVVMDPVVKFDTSLWDLNGQGKLVWSASTDSDGPATDKDFTASLTKKVVPMMSKAGVIPAPPGQKVSLTSRASMP